MVGTTKKLNHHALYSAAVAAVTTTITYDSLALVLTTQNTPKTLFYLDRDSLFILCFWCISSCLF